MPQGTCFISQNMSLLKRLLLMFRAASLRQVRDDEIHEVVSAGSPDRIRRSKVKAEDETGSLRTQDNQRRWWRSRKRHERKSRQAYLRILYPAWQSACKSIERAVRKFQPGKQLWKDPREILLWWCNSHCVQFQRERRSWARKSDTMKKKVWKGPKVTTIFSFLSSSVHDILPFSISCGCLFGLESPPSASDVDGNEWPPSCIAVVFVMFASCLLSCLLSFSLIAIITSCSTIVINNTNNISVQSWENVQYILIRSVDLTDISILPTVISGEWIPVFCFLCHLVHGTCICLRSNPILSGSRDKWMYSLCTLQFSCPFASHSTLYLSIHFMHLYLPSSWWLRMRRCCISWCVYLWEKTVEKRQEILDATDVPHLSLPFIDLYLDRKRREIVTECKGCPSSCYSFKQNPDKKHLRFFLRLSCLVIQQKEEEQK